MGTVTKIIGIIVGIIIVFFGLIIFGASWNMPVIFAGPYLILGVIITVIGAVIIWLGIRSGRKR